MKVRADDDIYRARLVYLGPPGYTLPVQLPYAQWGLFAVVAAVYVTVGLLLTGGSLMVVGVAVGAAMFTTSYIWGHVDPDRPARKILAAVASDWRRTRSEQTSLPRLSARRVRIREQL
jgi:hypothetical protein